MIFVLTTYHFTFLNVRNFSMRGCIIELFDIASVTADNEFPVIMWNRDLIL